VDFISKYLYQEKYIAIDPYPEIFTRHPKGSSFSPYWIWSISL
jgi:hypothetical protein